ncbi:methylase of chemotaxis methyl-accepting protein [Desulfosporosinus acidiphilus SJ4]|uniref:Methylase of chemotaxis methyl-accepting protein n=1 Tax=Desulfosporosinus acidiphilus (strain DSM 22704 / JCM 16185 / SJ4) TaxID=646529 RepID=I4D715_DESAJ|nr:protein-glutamate O-methyltransferase CheR [Desulfosporosinus acidiphilus]AFM41589.1 methylase of chemotaxis methyl-accepting protein [Desulfosporosinus acidiphilus SJ4]
MSKINQIESDVKNISKLEKLEIEFLLEGIFRVCGYDFREYNFPSIRRRIWHRVQAERLNTVSGLQEKVFHDPTCMHRLIMDFSIQVTEMFRDPEFFISFRRNVIPCLKELPYVRIWHAGCSTGEEVYSMAILLLEEGLYDKSRLYATDFNEEALEKAKKGIVSLEKMKTYTNNYLRAGGKQPFSKYYSVIGDEVIFDNILRRNTVFAQHNLVTDRSFNEFNVIVCRNVLIYFNKDLQNKAHSLFFDSLSSAGFFIIGKKESIDFGPYKQKYTELDKIEKIYKKI